MGDSAKKYKNENTTTSTQKKVRFAPSAKAHEEPNYLLRFLGVTLIVLSIVGCILPLLLLSGVVGILTAVGSFFVLLFGVTLTNSVVSHDIVEEEFEDLEAQESEVTESVIATTEEDLPADLKAFLGIMNDEVAKYEAGIDDTIKKYNIDNLALSEATSNDIQQLIEFTKTAGATEIAYWNLLESLSDLELKYFVRQLNVDKPSGKEIATDLDKLLFRFSDPTTDSVEQQRADKLLKIIKSLSDQQIKATCNSVNFFNLLRYKHYASTISKGLSREQIGFICANPKAKDAARLLTENLKTDESTLGKLLVVLPYVTRAMQKNLEMLIMGLPNLKTSEKTKLTRLVEFYIKQNLVAHAARVRAQVAKHANPNTKDTKDAQQEKRWRTVGTPYLQKVYANDSIEQVEWNEDALNSFLQKLNTTKFDFDQASQLISELYSMDSNTLKKLLKSVASPEYKNVLAYLWKLMAQAPKNLSDETLRGELLKGIWRNLSDELWKSSAKDASFWDVLKLKLDTYAKLAGEEFTPHQFELIIAHAKLEYHPKISQILDYVKRDTEEQKESLAAIIKAILPYTTPWVANTIDRRIQDLQGVNFKERKIGYKDDLKKYLKKSLSDKEVSARYKQDQAHKDSLKSLLGDSKDNASPISGTLNLG